MYVARIGLTPVKGLAHEFWPELDLHGSGPPGDRAFCFYDVVADRVLRTVDHDSLLACRARWDPPVLTISTPVGEATGDAEWTGEPAAPADRLVADYWGRPAELTAVRGPWSALVSRYLGKQVVLCRVGTPGGVVWGGPVSVVTTSSLAEVARRVGREPEAGEDGRRFRATFVVDTGDAPAFAEDAWTGRSLRLGDAVVRVRGPLERCALVDRRPESGGRDAMVLRALAADRRVDGQIVFGVHVDVEHPGTVRLGADVTVEESARVPGAAGQR
ncbi:MOSC domain-containing protein [Actinopolymorpha singaporensis]